MPESLNIKKLPIIRHVRYFWYSWRVRVHAMQWASIGVGLGIPNKSDLEHLDDIWRGDE